MERRARWTHAVSGLFVLGMLAAAWWSPAGYHGLVQEDGPIEWLTVGLFAAAGLVRLRSAMRGRRVFDGLVALFCLFVAGEEISWGQRLIGYVPPELFLESNVQQEANLHNFAELFGRPGLTLALLLVAYGGVLPLAAALGRRAAAADGSAPTVVSSLMRRVQRLLDRLGASAPNPLFIPWLLLAAALLVVYPVSYAGEWVEALVGGLFLAASPGLALPRRGRLARLAPWAFAGLVALVMTPVSAYARDPGGERTACASREAEALVRDLVAGTAARAPLATTGYVHKRLRSAVLAGYLEPLDAESWWAASPCPGETAADAASRRSHGVDPWGLSYWVLSDGRGDGRRVAVYSMGPNRRRDGRAAWADGDDVVVYAEVR